MRVFVTGASGWIGSAVVPELLAAGHQVARPGPLRRLGRRRSPRSAPRSTAATWTTSTAARRRRRRRRRRPPRLQPRLLADGRGGRRSTGARSTTFGDALAGTGGPLVIASGMLGLAPAGSRPSEDRPDPGGASRASRTPRRRWRSPTAASARSSCGSRRPCTAPATTASWPCSSASPASTGVSAYIGDGANRWPAVHRLDAARSSASRSRRRPAGSGRCTPSPRRASRPARSPRRSAVGSACRSESIPADAGGRALRLDRRRSSAPTCSPRATLTRELLGWAPTHPGLLADLEGGHYAVVPTP